MYAKLKENIKEKLYKSKELEMKKIVNEGIYHLLYNTNKEVNDIELSITKIINKLKKLLLWNLNIK